MATQHYSGFPAYNITSRRGLKLESQGILESTCQQWRETTPTFEEPLPQLGAFACSHDQVHF